MWFGVIFLILMVIFWLRRLIQSQLIGLVLLLGGTQRQAVLVYSLLFLPGVIVHELTHLLTAAMMGVRTGDISIIPNVRSDNEKRIALGFVRIEKTDFFRESVIGISPLLVGLFILGVLINLIGHSETINWQLVLMLYGVLTITNTMFVSREDSRAFLPIGICFSVVVILFYWIGWLLPLFDQIKKFGEPMVMPTLMSLIVVLAIDLGWWLCLKLWLVILERITNKRVI
jgi:hypothetical protein